MGGMAGLFITDEQIAEALDCAPTSVRVLLHRGIAALKKEIAE